MWSASIALSFATIASWIDGEPMSAIAGILYADARPVPASDLDILSSHNRPFGPDGGGTFLAAGLAMQACVLRFDALSGIERQPVQFAAGSVATFDGRLDNREDLLTALHFSLGDDRTDAALVACAWQRWGLDCLRQLIGDWSIAIWDAASETLTLACDYMGNRPLFYIDAPNGTFAWSTSLNALADRFARFSEPDDAYIAGRLTFGVPPGVTPFRGTRRIKAGHIVVVKRGQPSTTRRYWTFEPTTIRYGDRRDYDAHLRDLLIDAVRCRLRAEGTVWSHLSGGWDSSSVVCIAHALIQRAQVPARAVQPITRVWSNSPESDEAEFRLAVERWCGVPTIPVDSRDGDVKFGDLVGRRRPLSTFSQESLEFAVRQAGGRVVLSGQLGDLVMFKGSSHRISLLESLHAGHPLRFFAQCMAYARFKDQSLLTTFGQLMPAYLPPAVFERRANRHSIAAQALRSGVRSRKIGEVFNLTAAFAARTNPRPLSLSALTTPFPRVKRPMAGGLYAAGLNGAAGNLDLVPGVTMTCPYVHRPLVEFVLGVPQLAFWEPDTVRSGMRRIMDGMLPPLTLGRTCKVEVTAAVTRAVRALSAELAVSVRDCRLVTRGYLEESGLRRALTSVMDGSANRATFVTACVHLEAWLRTLETLKAERPFEASPQRAPIVAPAASTVGAA